MMLFRFRKATASRTFDSRPRSIVQQGRLTLAMKFFAYFVLLWPRSDASQPQPFVCRKSTTGSAFEFANCSTPLRPQKCFLCGHDLWQRHDLAEAPRQVYLELPRARLNLLEFGPLWSKGLEGAVCRFVAESRIFHFVVCLLLSVHSCMEGGIRQVLTRPR